MTKPFLHREHPIAFAHRGGANRWPENTLLAFERSLELGVRFIETDLHMTRDGVIVCFHDDTLERTTDGQGPIRERSWDELRRLDAGYRFTSDGQTHPFRGQGISIPTLAEALALHPDACFNIEIKQSRPSMVEALWRAIQEHQAYDRVLVAAARDPLVQAFRLLSRGRVCTSAGQREVFWFWSSVRAGLARFQRFPFDALQVPIRHGGLQVIEPRFLEAAHRQGIQVHVWTINHRAAMERLLALGVDGIVTDRPGTLLEVLGRSPA